MLELPQDLWHIATGPVARDALDAGIGAPRFYVAQVQKCLPHRQNPASPAWRHSETCAQAPHALSEDDAPWKTAGHLRRQQAEERDTRYF